MNSMETTKCAVSPTNLHELSLGEAELGRATSFSKSAKMFSAFQRNLPQTTCQIPKCPELPDKTMTACNRSGTILRQPSNNTKEISFAQDERALSSNARSGRFPGCCQGEISPISFREKTIDRLMQVEKQWTKNTWNMTFFNKLVKSLAPSTPSIASALEINEHADDLEQLRTQHLAPRPECERKWV